MSRRPEAEDDTDGFNHSDASGAREALALVVDILIEGRRPARELDSRKNAR